MTTSTALPLAKGLIAPNLDSQNTVWDLIVIGGGITGAGIALEAAKLNKQVLLLEQYDFAWGTSSRSSKMVHGGLRYLGQGDIKLTRHSLLERERLLQDAPDLVVRKAYLFPIIKGHFPGRWSMKLVLWFYDVLAGIRDHRWLGRKSLRKRLPKLQLHGLKGAMSYTDALTDDSRLVLKVLHEACSEGAFCQNYYQVKQVVTDNGVINLEVVNQLTHKTSTFKAHNVVNATGAFADYLSGATPRVRPQRGSHLFIQANRLPVGDCLTLLHPADGRPVFLFPWQGVTCVGTTDLDHKQPLTEEAKATKEEISYLLTLINSAFPDYHITENDIVSCMAGVRPIISSGKGLDPSKERRDHAIWQANNVITVSGGKLTTFRLIALDVMQALGWLNTNEHKSAQHSKCKLFNYRLPFMYGNPLAAVPSNQQLKAQIDWILQNEQVVHLDDLMLRRTRLGLLLPQGGHCTFEVIKPLCLQHLAWSEAQWQQEVERYLLIINNYYQPPNRTISFDNDCANSTDEKTV